MKPRTAVTSSLLVCALTLSACANIEPRKQVVSSPDAPTAIGPYSQAVRHGNMLFLSGQIPIQPGANTLLGTASIEDQTKLVLDNLRAVLSVNGMTLDDVVMTQVFMKELGEFPRMNQVYATYFPANPPARATVEVARLPRDVRIEISAIAIK